MFNKPCNCRGPRQCEQPKPCIEREVVEPTVTNCVEREFYHEVPHVVPVHTHVVNKHIYKHTYTPCFTCSEENVVCDMGPDCCGR